MKPVFEPEVGEIYYFSNLIYAFDWNNHPVIFIKILEPVAEVGWKYAEFFNLKTGTLFKQTIKKNESLSYIHREPLTNYKK